MKLYVPLLVITSLSSYSVNEVLSLVFTPPNWISSLLPSDSS